MDEQPDIIAITEAKPKNSRFTLTYADYQLKGYEVFTHNLDSRPGRGIIIYTKTALKAVILNTESDFSEHLFILMRLANNETLTFGCAYRSPNSSDTNNSLLDSMIHKLDTMKSTYKVLVGDFNYPTIRWEDGSATAPENSTFGSALLDTYMTQHVTEPTRGRNGQEPSILDLVISNDPNIITAIIYDSPLGKSDHACLRFELKCHRTHHNISRKFYLYDKGDYEKMANELNSINWEDELENQPDANSAFEAFTGIMNSLVDKYIPVKLIDSSKKQKKPFDKTVLRAVKKKHRAWQRYMETRSGEKYTEYVRRRNKVSKLTRQAQKDYEKIIAKEAKKNPKKFWNYVKSKTKSPSNIPDLLIDEEDPERGVASDDKDKADVLADFYSSVFTNEPPGPVPEPRAQDVNSTLETSIFSENRIKKKLSALNTSKSPGPDMLHSRVLKEIAPAIVKPLQWIFSSTMHSGKLPSIWKQANVSPIFKKGKKQHASNYRPVSLTCILCKVQESMIRDDIIAHMNANQLISSRQFGFLSGRSTILQLLHVVEEWTEILDGGGSINVCYMDFMKAFDKVPHRRLIAKLRSYGIHGNLLNWIQSFLEGRQQRVVINGQYSSWREVTSGIPQGSVLGPLLFVIYINDLPDTVLSRVFLFADDTKIYRQILSQQDHFTFQDDITKLQEWADKWLLRFHPDKCKMLSIGNAEPDFQYTMYTEDQSTVPLSYVQSEKDVGVIFDTKLTFREDLSTRATKANNIMGVIRRTYTYLDIETFRLLFKSLVRPHLEYGAPIWNPKLKCDIATLENVQRRATRQIPALKGKSYPERLQCLKLPTLRFRRLRGDMIETYKLLHNIYDPTLPALLTPVANPVTRGHSLKLPKGRFKTYSFTHRVVNDWNSLPEEVISAPSINAFKNRLDSHWKNHPWLYDWEGEWPPL